MSVTAAFRPGNSKAPGLTNKSGLAPYEQPQHAGSAGFDSYSGKPLGNKPAWMASVGVSATTNASIVSPPPEARRFSNSAIRGAATRANSGAGAAALSGDPFLPGTLAVAGSVVGTVVGQTGPARDRGVHRSARGLHTSDTAGVSSAVAGMRIPWERLLKAIVYLCACRVLLEGIRPAAVAAVPIMAGTGALHQGPAGLPIRGSQPTKGGQAPNGGSPGFPPPRPPQR